MSESISDVLNPNRLPLEPYGLKAEKTLNRITLNPSSVNPGETLYVNIPKLAEGLVIVPGSVALLFNLNVTDQANNTLVNNVGRKLATSLKVKFGGEILQDTQRYDLLKTYNDLFLSKEKGKIDSSKASHQSTDKVITAPNPVEEDKLELDFDELSLDSDSIFESD